MTVSEARELLGLRPGADGQTIARAYRSAVKAAHPDRDGGDVERLRQVIEAHRLLTPTSPERLTFTLMRRPAETAAPRRLGLQISVEEALFGGERAVETQPDRQLNVRLPAGLKAGDVLRLAGADDGVDVLLQISIAAEPGVAVRGADLWIEVEIDADALQAGGCLEIDTPRGRQVFLAPKAAEDSGVVMVRFKGQGLPARGSHPVGDMVINLAIRESRSRALLRRFSSRWAA
jgi:curved DNA-binding protein